MCLEKLKIVVVDDELAARTNASELLRRIPDCELVGMAENGAQALELARTLTPHVMLVDVSMPEMTGLELGQKLKEEYPEIQVIMLTMYSDFDYAVRAFRDGAVDYILKDTYDVEPLTQALQKARGRMVTHSEREAAQWAYELERQIHERAWRERQGYFLCFAAQADCPVNLADQRGLLTGCFEHCYPVESGLWFGTEKRDKARLPKGILSSLFVLEANEESLTQFKSASQEAFYFPMTDQLSGAAYAETFSSETRNHLRQQFKKFMVNDDVDFPGDYTAECIESHISPESMKELLITCLRDMDSAQHTFHENIGQIQSANSSQEVVLALRTAQLQWQFHARRREHTLVVQLKQYIGEHLSENLSLSVLAEQVGFNAAYVSALFKSETGDGLKRYITNMRLARAEELLKTTHLKIYEIAEQCGFDSARYFSDLFAKTYNMTPQKYRRWG